MSRRRSPLRHRAEYAAVRLVAGVCNHVPEGVARRAGASVGWLAARVGRPRWGTVTKQLRIAFPDADESWLRDIARRSYSHLGAEAVSMFRLGRMGSQAIRDRTELTSQDFLERSFRKGRGLMFVSGHLGNWEIGAAAVAARGYPVDVVVARQRNPFFDAYLTGARERLGMQVIPRGEARPGVLASLRAGRVVGIMGDQDARRAGIFVDFFGRPAATARGPAVLALRAGAEMATLFAVRLPDRKLRYRVFIEPVALRPGRRGRRDGGMAAEVASVTQAFTSRLEARVREHPGQYFWLHRRWKTAPPPPARSPDNPSPAQAFRID